MVTVMKADSAIQLDPSVVCTVDAKSAFDHLIRESSGGHGRRKAEGALRVLTEHASLACHSVAGCPTA